MYVCMCVCVCVRVHVGVRVFALHSRLSMALSVLEVWLQKIPQWFTDWD